MNREELLADINEQIEIRKKLGLGDVAWSWNALRAVVELHKPDDYCCPVCGVEYPCPTIRAIEKELQ